jgi:hypothetical protein
MYGPCGRFGADSYPFFKNRCNLEYLSGRVNIMMYSAIMNIPSGCGRDLV